MLAFLPVVQQEVPDSFNRVVAGVRDYKYLFVIPDHRHSCSLFDLCAELIEIESRSHGRIVLTYERRHEREDQEQAPIAHRAQDGLSARIESSQCDGRSDI